MAYYPNSLPRVTATFRDPDTEVLVDPTAVVATVTDPHGAVTTPTVARAELGVYEVVVPVDSVGLWTVIWSSTGAYAGVAPTVINVQPLPQAAAL